MPAATRRTRRIEEVCSGYRTQRSRARRVRPAKVTYETLLKVFWESHDPTQGMRQGDDVGTQYRSGIYVFDAEQREAARGQPEELHGGSQSAGSRRDHHRDPRRAEFYYAEDYHQQYLAKNPDGYCGLGGCGVSFVLDEGQQTSKA